MLIPTRHRINNQSSILDLVFSSNPDAITNIESPAPLGKSDHLMIYLTLDLNTYTNPPVPRPLYNKGKFSAMRNSFLYYSNDYEDVNIKYNNLVRSINDLVEKHVPKTKPSVNTKHTSKFIDKSTKKLIQKKHRLFQRYIETKDPIKWNNYARIRNQVKTKIRSLRRQEELEVAVRSKVNPKAFWRFVKKKTNSIKTLPDLISNGVTAKTDQQKSELLSTFFASVFTAENTSDMPDILHRVHSSISNFIITESEVKDILIDLNINKAHDIDGIHPKSSQRIERRAG